MALEDLKPSEKNALFDLRLKLQNFLTSDPTSSNLSSLWGVPLLHSQSNPCLDTVLLKFLRARDFNADESLRMLQRRLRWREEYGVDGILEQESDSDSDLDFCGTTYMCGFDREGHPVCYNVFRSFRQSGLCRKTLGTKGSCERFLRWRVRFMEKGIQEFLSFEPGKASAMLQVIDLKDSLGSSMKEVRSAMERMIKLFQDNYPEFVVKNIFVNVSFRYYTYHALFSPLLTPRMKSKFVFVRPSKVTETLLKYINLENIPNTYGGFKRENDEEFSAENGKASEASLKGGSTAIVEIAIIEPRMTLVWDITVVGWEVMYKQEFKPDDECSYNILIQEERKLEQSMRNSFYFNETGKLVLTIENKTFKKKRIFYRSKTKPTIPSYNLL
ncbi:hypothetical protein HPP92_020466 [Vanilla planifolia]|uniref:CRAL-TRIO domain-containing protein n=1 Tax=Vanilla planifolia TaxID=51239 RepID=A0A835PX41_VANPL|nr:hypothetical protein HPP92_020466 [Vanilla planifolia]